MREIGPIVNVGPDIFEVPSYKPKTKKKDVYIVDLRGPYCDCKGFYHTKKQCCHIKAVIQLLRAGGHCIRWNKKEKCHYDMGLV